MEKTACSVCEKPADWEAWHTDFFDGKAVLCDTHREAVATVLRKNVTFQRLKVNWSDTVVMPQEYEKMPDNMKELFKCAEGKTGIMSFKER